MSNSKLTETEQYVLRLIKTYIFQKEAQLRAPNNADNNELRKSHDALLRFIPATEIDALFQKYRKNAEIESYAHHHIEFKKHCLTFEVSRLDKELDNVDKKFDALERKLNNPSLKPKSRSDNKDEESEEVKDIKQIREKIKLPRNELKQLQQDLNKPPFDEFALRMGETKLQSLIIYLAPIKNGITRWQDKLLLSAEEAFSRKEPFNRQNQHTDDNKPTVSPTPAPRLTPYKSQT